ncbi:MAG: hypothetical protein CMJ58_21485 [Planctomycetaceae bacterium]|nr:hypothetical protein [Planctomycetaceae bacterium]
MFKRMLILGALVVGFAAASAAPADAGIFYRRVAPVRRVAARAVLPPYPVARRVVAGPVYRPYYRPAYGYGYGYGPGVSVRVGW